MGHYKYKLPKAVIHKTKIKPSLWPKHAMVLAFGDASTNWLILQHDGTIEVQAGYAWDGCSPKFSLLDLAWVGTPDGIEHPDTGLPKTYYASLIHDALCQFASRPAMPYSQADIDRIFLELMEQSGFKLSRPYYWAVRWFGDLFRRFNHE